MGETVERNLNTYRNVFSNGFFATSRGTQVNSTKKLLPVVRPLSATLHRIMDEEGEPFQNLRRFRHSSNPTAEAQDVPKPIATDQGVTRSSSLLRARDQEQFDGRTSFFANHGGEFLAPLEQRSKSERIICTTQGVVFQGKTFQRYKVRVDDLIQLAANPVTSHSNVLIAKKALRYRKVLERRHACAQESGSRTSY
ncbi:hypothetical protein BBJ28_00024817 [Nothophytophthora sp. Chile5]|nr:hypothetical protein BBJ28_00024817 [Nothophytophthora sp. Chile5]